MTATSPATRPETAQEPVARPLWWGAVDGVVAGLVTVGLATLAAAALVALGQSSGQPAPIAAVSGAFIDRTPPWLKDFAVSTFGTNDKLFLTTMVIVVAILLQIAEVFAKRAQLKGFDDMRVPDAVAIGIGQCLALIPGSSRSGSTISSGVRRAGRSAGVSSTPRCSWATAAAPRGSSIWGRS